MKKSVAVDDYVIVHREDKKFCIQGKGLESEYDANLAVMFSRKGGLLFATSPQISFQWSKAPHRSRAVFIGIEKDLFALANHLQISDWQHMEREALGRAVKAALFAIVSIVVPPPDRVGEETDFDLREKLLSRLTEEHPWHLKADIENASGMELNELAKQVGTK